MSRTPRPGSARSAPADPLPLNRLAVWGAIAALAAAFAAAYSNSFSGAYVLDDISGLSENASIRDLRHLAAVLCPPGNLPTGGRPVLNLAFALNYAVNGSAVRGYHVVNLLIHVLAGLTLFGVIRRTLVSPGLRARFGGASTAIAFAAALVWGLHPVQTEAVTYLSQRAESLMALLYLLTLYGYIRSTEPGRAGLWAAVSVGALMLGVATKEVVATAPVLVFLYDLAFVGGSPSAALRRRPWYYPALAGTWVVLGLLMAHSPIRAHGVGYSLGLGPVSYALIEGKVILKYIGLAFWPHPLVFDYGREVFLPTGARYVPYGLAVLALLGAAAAAWWRGFVSAGFLGVAFFLLLAPTSTVVPIAGQPMAESRLYLPLAAIVVLLVTAGYGWAGRWALGLFLVAAAGLGAMTFARNADYRSAEGLWRDTLAKNPLSSRGWLSLGYAVGGDPARADEAIADYRRALDILPNYPEAHSDLALMLARKPGREQEAAAHYEIALRITPDNAVIQSNLADLLVRMPGRQAEAISHYETSLRLDPNNASAENNLGNLFAGQPGHQAEAIAHWEAATRLNPGYAGAEFNLALLLSTQPGRRQEAIAHCERALKINPDLAQARQTLARLQAGGPP